MYQNPNGQGNPYTGNPFQGYQQEPVNQGGYPPMPQGTMPGMEGGYGYPPNQGAAAPYVQQPQGGTAYQNPWQQPNAGTPWQQPAQQGYPYQDNAYYNGMAQGYGNGPQQPNPMPYSQPNAPQGYYNPYGQPNPYGAYGGMYPQQGMAQPQKKSFQLNLDTVLRVLLFALVPALFLVSMFVPGLPVYGKWVFAGVALVCGATMWLRDLVSANTRLTLSVVYVVMIVVACVAAVTANAPSSTTVAGGNQAGSGTSHSSGPVAPPASVLGTTGLEQDTAAVVTTAPPAVEDPLKSEAVTQMQSFFYFWSVNKHDEMVSLCAPSWQSGEEKPNTALFGILANRTPLEYEVEKITGTANDTTRTITVVATIDKGNNREPSKYRLQVVMLKENETWYVDPRSLKSQEAAESTAAPTPEATYTPTPAINGSTVLYYNPNGGTKYHLDDHCRSAHASYLPFKGTFRYSELNNDPYKSLTACNVCGAPLREQ